MAANIQQEKRADRERRASIKRQIEEDRKNNPISTMLKSRDTMDLDSSHMCKSSEDTPSSSSSNVCESLIQIRLPDGSCKREKFGVNCPLGEVYSFARNFLTPEMITSGFSMIQPFPRQDFGVSENLTKTLRQLNLVPNGNLVIKITKSDSHSGGSAGNSGDSNEIRIENPAVVSNAELEPQIESSTSEANRSSSSHVSSSLAESRLRALSRGGFVVDDTLAFTQASVGNGNSLEHDGNQGSESNAAAHAALTRLETLSRETPVQQHALDRHAVISSLFEMALKSSSKLIEHYGINFGANYAEAKGNISSGACKRPDLQKLSASILSLLLKELISQRLLNLKIFSVFAEHSGHQLCSINLKGYEAVSNEYLYCLRHTLWLKNLNISCCPLVTDQGIRYLRGVRDIEELNLGGCRITDTSVEVFVKFTKLRNLCLDSTSVSNQGISLLAESLTKLEVFSINSCAHISNEALVFLCQHDHICNSLSELSLNRTGIDDISPLSRVQSLQKLCISFTPINDAMLRVIGQRMTQLRWLSISSHSNASLSLEAISLLSHLPIKHIDLPHRLLITDDVLKEISKLAALERLDLTDCVYVTDVGIKWMSSLCKFRRFAFLI